MVIGEKCSRARTGKTDSSRRFQPCCEKGSDAQRQPAVTILKERGEKAATRLLTVYETSTSEDTASASLEALAAIRGKSSVATYRKALKNRFGRVRAAGFSAIRQFGPKALLDTAIAGVKDKDPLSRVQAARAALTLVKSLTNRSDQP